MSHHPSPSICSAPTPTPTPKMNTHAGGVSLETYPSRNQTTVALQGEITRPIVIFRATANSHFECQKQERTFVEGSTLAWFTPGYRPKGHHTTTEAGPGTIKGQLNTENNAY